MKHAIIHLRAELLKLREQLRVARDGGAAEQALVPQLQKEIGQTQEGLAVLLAAEHDVAETRRSRNRRGQGIHNDWERHLFEPYAERKARLAQERALHR